MTRMKKPLRITRNKTGPKREFTEEQLRQVDLLAKLGASDKQLALFFEVGIGTVEKWTATHPEFVEARKRGGLTADMKVAQSLYKRATGYSYIEEEYTAVTDPETGRKLPLNEMAFVKKIKKIVIPDTKAAIHWLRIRQRQTWSVVDEMLHRHTGKIEHLHRKLQEIPVEELSLDAQKLLFEIAQKQLTVGTRDN